MKAWWHIPLCPTSVTQGIIGHSQNDRNTTNPYVLDSSMASGLTQPLDAQSLKLKAESSKLEAQSWKLDSLKGGRKLWDLWPQFLILSKLRANILSSVCSSCSLLSMCDANVEIVHGSRCKNIHYGGDKNGKKKKNLENLHLRAPPQPGICTHSCFCCCTYYFYMLAPLNIFAHNAPWYYCGSHWRMNKT